MAAPRPAPPRPEPPDPPGDPRPFRRRARLGCSLALAAGLAAGCADRAQARTVEEPPAATATDLRLSVRSDGGGTFALRAAEARLAPGFPAAVAGEFDEARAEFRAAAKQDAAPPAESLSVRARRMRYDSRAGRASFAGDVRVSIKEFELACDDLQVTYHGDGDEVDFVATGSIRVERPDLTATAGKAEYLGRDKTLTLTESPRVSGNLGELEGARIVLAVGEETVTVEEVRGTFRIR